MRESAFGRSGGRIFHQKERENISLKWNNKKTSDYGKRGNESENREVNQVRLGLGRHV